MTLNDVTLPSIHHINDAQLPTDVMIMANEQKFFVHRSVLRLHSAVFFAMFSRDWVENITNRVSINDIDPAVIKDLLIYVYSGSIPNIESHTGRLLCSFLYYKITNIISTCSMNRLFHTTYYIYNYIIDMS